MRVVATEYISLDGVFEEPGEWSFPFFNEQASQFKYNELFASDALLLGRKTYDGFAAAWPTMEGTGDFGKRMNTMPKYVVSSTLHTLDWPGSQLITVDEIGKLREQPGRDVLLSGSGQLFNTLAEADLIDLYRFMLHPIVVGGGQQRLYPEGSGRKNLELTHSETFDSGIVILEYERAA
ncbi:MAG: dihydrofolate reductase family protein [Actinomycetota bacterium]|nr:dihydrofolate reductase family protein [Actinomycetota bacterium]